MKILQNIWAELIGLFVDDWAFAGLALAWVALFALPGVRAQAALAGPALFLGLAVLTLVFVVRKARR
jgi:hypothetical protein